MALPRAPSRGRRRTLLDAVAADEPTLFLQLSAGDRVPAHRELLQFMSSCVKGLPPGDIWDLSEVLVEGEPVSRAVVVAWVEVVYNASPTSYSDDGTELPPEEPGRGVPAAPLLLFADAVGSSARVIRACYERCKAQFEAITVKLGSEQLQLSLDGRGYCCLPSGDLIECTVSRDDVLRQLPMPQEAAFKVIRPQIAAQLEPMLHLAYRLRLDELRDKLHHFVLTNTMFRSSLLTRGLLTSAVFSERVMAAVDRRKLRDAWIDSVINEAGDASRAGGLFEVVLAVGAAGGGLPGAAAAAAGAAAAGGATDSVVAAELMLKRPFMGSPAGTRVKLEADLRTGQMCRDDGEVCMVCKVVVGGCF
ncbi:MAG: hypothetical protein J3K34DRAFT_524435 [Monoraphidium minutum]|nr:MAG: hypothetical protein J3K34DRAFT_524435 [Monoraphidium minutum]